MTPIERRAEELRQRYPDGPMPRPSAVQMRLSWTVMVLLTLIGAIQTAGPESLGIPDVIFRWLGVLAVTFSIIQGFLPSIQRVGGGRG